MVSETIKQAQRMHRKAIEATYDGTCRIYGMQSVKDPVTKVTRQEEVLKQEEIPCHLSYSSTAPAAGSDTVTSAVLTIKLFLAPELVVPPGCRIEITQQGRTESYAQSGKAELYSSHQEIMLESWKKYA